MHLLVDTNILIQLEDNMVIDETFAGFYKLAILNNYKVYYHSHCLKDIVRDKDEERKQITLSKLKKYNAMPNPAEITEEFKNLVGEKKANDEVDNVQLFQVYKNYVDYFITEDKGIRSKAERLNISDKVLSVEEAFGLLKGKHNLVIPTHPLLQHCSVREIENSLNSVFFDSLRESYPGFNDWFLKCARQNRMCYILKVNNVISALLIYHEEKATDHLLPNVTESAMKMCTLKVDETAFGYKLGELFLNKMFELCVKNGPSSLYLTVFPHHTHLISLLEKYGFEKYEYTNKDSAVELRMIKKLMKPSSKSDKQNMSSHPFYFDDESINKFVIPIEPKYYFTLFKDGSYRQPGFFDEAEDSLNEIEGNTISKAYLCKSKSLAMKKGDLLFFYCSRDIGAIEPIGVLDEVVYTKDLDKIRELVKRKTVYKDEDLQELTSGTREVHITIQAFVLYG